jgi:hypothetical protein
VREENLFREIFVLFPFREEVQKHLNVGRIQITRNEVNFIVSSLEEITNVIIPLFDKHPVRDGKYRSYLVFKKVVEMMNQKEHTTLQGFMTILELSYFTHSTSNRTLESKQEILTNLLLPLPFQGRGVKINFRNPPLRWIRPKILPTISRKFIFSDT